MSAISHVRTDQASAPTGAYSQAVTVGPLVVTAGQVGADAKTGLLGESLAEQVQLAIRNIAAVLDSVGASLGDVVKTTCYLDRIQDFPEFDAAYRDLMPQPFPARSTVGASLAGEILVEIEAWALLPAGDA